MINEEYPFEHCLLTCASLSHILSVDQRSQNFFFQPKLQISPYSLTQNWLYKDPLSFNSRYFQSFQVYLRAMVAFISLKITLHKDPTSPGDTPYLSTKATKKIHSYSWNWRNVMVALTWCVNPNGIHVNVGISYHAQIWIRTSNSSVSSLSVGAHLSLYNCRIYPSTWQIVGVCN